MKPINNLPPFKRFCVTIGNLPSSYVDSMSYYECIMWLCKYLKDTVIPAVNENAEAVNELINWFNNLDVQDEVNNKLDEMAESGELEEIIASYLNVNAILCYNTKADMKSAENLIEGSVAKTLGNSNYLDGYGALYKIRTITSGDVVDDIHIIALNTSETLIAELIPDSNMNNINNIINNNIMKKNQKLICCENTYSPQFDLKGNQYGLSYERIGDNGSSFNHQGLCVNNVDGIIYGNDSEHIFKLETTQPTTKTILYNINLGHGGDCCIYYNKMYVIDGEHNVIHIVDLSDGSDTTITIPEAVITNNNTNGNPVAGGICVLESDIYIAVNDELDVHTNLPTNGTIRIYKYNLTEQIFRKIFETDTNVCYVQGMTMDEDNIYIAGNKPFDSSYSGTIMYIINKKELRLLDKIQNNFSGEFEGLDYCSLYGIEGILTSINQYGSFSYLGIYAFNGNTSRQVIYTDSDNHWEKTICVSKGGAVHVHFEITRQFTANESYTIDNFLKSTFLGYVRGTGGRELAVKGIGTSRADNCNVKYNFIYDRLGIYPVEATSSITVDFDLIAY